LNGNNRREVFKQQQQSPYSLGLKARHNTAQGKTLGKIEKEESFN